VTAFLVGLEATLTNSPCHTEIYSVGNERRSAHVERFMPSLLARPSASLPEEEGFSFGLLNTHPTQRDKAQSGGTVSQQISLPLHPAESH
jgi:hypothetical protein